MDDLDQIAIVPELQAFHVPLFPEHAPAGPGNHIAPVTGVLTMYFPADYSAADKYILEEDFKRFLTTIEGNAPAPGTFAGGWVVEALPIPGTSDKAKAFVASLGWQSTQECSAFGESQSFKGNTHPLSRAKDLQQVQEVHFSGIRIDQEGGIVADIFH